MYPISSFCNRLQNHIVNETKYKLEVPMHTLLKFSLTTPSVEVTMSSRPAVQPKSTLSFAAQTSKLYTEIKFKKLHSRNYFHSSQSIGIQNLESR